jgi:hypothetical protein
VNFDFLTSYHLNRNKNSIAVSIENKMRKIKLLNIPKNSSLKEFQMSLMKSLLRVACCISMLTAFTASEVRAFDKAPPEVQKIKETLSEQDLLIGAFEHIKTNAGFDSSIKISDLKTEEPVPIYYIKKDSINKIDENASISATMQKEKVWAWMLPVIIKGKCIATLTIGKTEKNPEWHAMELVSPGSKKMDPWEHVRESWPESAGYHPVIVYLTSGHKYFHIPEIDDNNLTPLYRLPFDSLSRSADSSYKNLMPSKNVFKYAKTHFTASLLGGGK